ncbi:MAG: acyltransferase [Kofleriaceae bacterium]
MTERPPRYIPGLDGLRAIAILVVIVHNTSINEANDTLIARVWTAITDSGWIGVQLFFVLSGFLITGLLLDGRDKPRALRTFYARRALRIFPLYYVFLIGRFLVLPLVLPAVAVGFSTQIWYWLYLSNWSDLVQGPINGMGHFWSLAVEEQFYLSWPVLVRKLRLRTFVIVCVALVASSLVARIAFLFAGVDRAWMYSATISRVDALAIGALVAVAARASLGPRYVRARRRAAAIAVAGMAIVAVHAHGLSRFNPEIQTIGYTLLAVVFGVVVAELAEPRRARGLRVLELPVLCTVGRYSYAMYVFHAPINVAIQYFARGWILQHTGSHPIVMDVVWTLSIAVASFVLALVSHTLIEAPFLKLRPRTPA